MVYGYGFVYLAWQVFRQMRAEYFRLSEKGLPDADLLDKLRKAYQTTVNRTDPLQKYRGDKIPQKWNCPKVSPRPASTFSRHARHDNDVNVKASVFYWPLKSTWFDAPVWLPNVCVLPSLTVVFPPR